MKLEVPLLVDQSLGRSVGWLVGWLVGKASMVDVFPTHKIRHRYSSATSVTLGFFSKVPPITHHGPEASFGHGELGLFGEGSRGIVQDLSAR